MLATSWMKGTQARRALAEARPKKPARRGRMTQKEIMNLVTEQGGIMQALKGADPADKAGLYRRIGLCLNLQTHGFARAWEQGLAGCWWLISAVYLRPNLSQVGLRVPGPRMRAARRRPARSRRCRRSSRRRPGRGRPRPVRAARPAAGVQRGEISAVRSGPERMRCDREYNAEQDTLRALVRHDLAGDLQCRSDDPSLLFRRCRPHGPYGELSPK